MLEADIEVLASKANAWLDTQMINDRKLVLEEGRLLQQQLKQAASENPQLVGPLLGAVISRIKHIGSMEQINWVNVAGGKVAIGHRPAKTRMEALRLQGCTHILTLLSDREGATDIRRGTEAAGMDWVWFSMENGNPPPPERDSEAALLFDTLHNALKTEARIYIHCSAGIHRTGMLAYGLLRYLGHSQEDADALLLAMRQDTSDGVGDLRKQWADRFTNWKISAETLQP